MSGSLNGLVLGAVGLALLDAVVSTQQGSTNVGGLVAVLSRIIGDFLSPQVPTFKTSASTTSSAPAATATLVAAAAPAPPALSPAGPTVVPNAPSPSATLV